MAETHLSVADIHELDRALRNNKFRGTVKQGVTIDALKQTVRDEADYRSCRHVFVRWFETARVLYVRPLDLASS